MTYETALALKEAGYPQKGKGEWFNNSTHETTHNEFSDNIYAPTLEELIEACGEDFDALFSNYSSLTVEARGKWRADATNRTGFSVIGNSSIEAVARLWINLHKK